MRQMSLWPKLMYSHCNERRVDARQQEGEFVRIPYAEMSLYPVPARADEEALVMLSTFCRPLRMRRYQQPGGSIAIVGWRSPSRSSGWSRAPFGIYTNRTISRTASLLPFAIFFSARPFLPSASALRFTILSTVALAIAGYPSEMKADCVLRGIPFRTNARAHKSQTRRTKISRRG
jgi:hypothetical protein